MDLSQLNPPQRAAVLHTGTPLLVLAGAGSGKTSVITRKIAYLISELNYPPSRVLAMTFTNKAAREMKERVASLLPKGGTRGLTVGTFHSWGLQFIRKEAAALNMKPGFSILDGDDVQQVITDLLGTTNIDKDQLRAISSAISHWKNELISPSAALSHAESEDEARYAEIYAQVTRYMRACNCVDFDDLIALPSWLLESNPEVRERWQNKIRYLLVDEYQDTNLAQYRLVRHLVGSRQCFTAVGDDDQSIYAWRGARVENLFDLQTDFPLLEVIKLEQNYRSMQGILTAANQLIANNPHEHEKALWSDKGLGEPLRILACANEEAEAERVANAIVDHRLRTQSHYRDYAILYRSNFQARAIEMRLQQYRVPYKLTGGTSFFSRAEVRDAMGYLRLLLNPDDDNALLRVINTPRRGIGASTLEKLGEYAQDRERPMLSCIQELGFAQTVKPSALENLKNFAELIDEKRQALNKGDGLRGILELFAEIDYEGHLLSQATTPSQGERKVQNFQFLIDALRKDLANPDPDLESLEGDEADADDLTDETRVEAAIRKLVLRDLLERQEEEDDTDRVQMATLHASKGLEFPFVTLVGVEEGLLPHRSSIDGGMVEEERRLAYVGITRAMKELTITYCKSRKMAGEKVEVEPSRFLSELPEDLLDWEGRTPLTEEENRAKGASVLANLLAGFD